MSESWGPQCIVPSPLRRTYSGKVTLSESFDQCLLRQELVAHEMPTEVVRVNNAWYYRRINCESWLAYRRVRRPRERIFR